MSPKRHAPAPGPDQDPAEQPLWRGQLAPVEGAETSEDRRRTTRRWGPHALRIIVGFLLLGLVALAVVLWAQSRSTDPLSLRALAPGDCLTSAAVRAGDTDLDDLERTSCDEPHDGEVFAIFDAGDDVTTTQDAGRRCGELLGTVGIDLQQVTLQGLEVRPLTNSGDLTPDTRVVCFLRNRSGEKMSETLVDHSTEPQTEE